MSKQDGHDNFRADNGFWYSECIVLNIGDFYVNHTTVGWAHEMWETCGKKYKDVKNIWDYNPDWLEKRMTTILYVKKGTEIAKLLFENGYNSNESDGFVHTDRKLIWIPEMWKTCGHKASDWGSLYKYHPDWLEEREVEK